MTREKLMNMIRSRYTGVIVHGNELAEVERILDAHVSAWNEGESYTNIFPGFVREADTQEEMDALIETAHKDVAEAIIHEWLSDMHRHIAVGLVNGIMPYGHILYAGAILTAEGIADRWNKCHPNEEPLTRTNLDLLSV